MKSRLHKILKSTKRKIRTRWLHSQPTMLNIFVTNRCNFSCTYCSRNTKDNIQSDLCHYADKSDFSLSDLSFLLGKYPGIKHVLFIGIGEPFLAKDLIPMAKFAKLNHKYVTVITNASLIHNHWGNIAPFFDDILISLHAFNPQDLSRIANVKQEIYQQIIENVHHLALIERKANPSLNIRASVVVLKEELYRVREAAQFCADHFIPILDLQNYLPYDLSNTEQVIFDDDIDEISYIQSVIEEFSGLIKINPLIPIKRYITALSWGCQSFFQTLRVDGLGQVSGCARMMVPKRQNGDCWQEDDVWKNKYFEEMRKKFRTHKDLPECCRFCPESQ